MAKKKSSGIEPGPFMGDGWSTSASGVKYREFVDPQTGKTFYQEITEEDRQAYQREMREKEQEDWKEVFCKMAGDLFRWY